MYYNVPGKISVRMEKLNKNKAPSIISEINSMNFEDQKHTKIPREYFKWVSSLGKYTEILPSELTEVWEPGEEAQPPFRNKHVRPRKRVAWDFSSAIMEPEVSVSDFPYLKWNQFKLWNRYIHTNCQLSVFSVRYASSRNIYFQCATYKNKDFKQDDESINN